MITNSYIQHPRETTEQLGVDALQIGDDDLLAEDHLVERGDEVRIEEPPVEDAETQAATDELEVVQVLGVHARRGVDLQRVVVVRGVLEQTVKRIEHLVGEQEEEFSVMRVSNVYRDNHPLFSQHTLRDHRNRDRPRRRT